MRALVAGAAGFIGAALCRKLRSAGADVHGVSRTTRSGEGVTWLRSDLADSAATLALFDSVRPDVVFHLASHVAGARALDAIGPTFRDNLLTTVNVLTASCQVGKPRVVLAGSMEEDQHGDTGGVPGSPYAAAKMAASTYARMFHALFDLPVVNLRIFMVYGPGQHDTAKLVPYVTTTMLRGDRPKLTAGTREIDWVYIDDVVAAFVAAAESGEADGEPVDIGSGERTSVRSIVERLALLVGDGVSPIFGAVGDRPLEHQRVADLMRARKLLGWQPATSLDVGLRRTVEWYRTRMITEAVG